MWTVVCGSGAFKVRWGRQILSCSMCPSRFHYVNVQERLLEVSGMHLVIPPGVYRASNLRV